MTPHSLGSPYVRDQLSVRAVPLNDKRTLKEETVEVLTVYLNSPAVSVAPERDTPGMRAMH